MSRLPFLTLTVASLLLTIFAVTGSRERMIRAELRRVHARHGMEAKVSVLLAEACARQNPTEGDCIGRGREAARAVLAEENDPRRVSAEARALVEEFRSAPRSIYELPGYRDFSEAWENERGDLARLAADEKILLGRHWSYGAAFWSLWEHASLPHLLFNVMNLMLFGVLVEWIAGKRAWALGFFAGGLAGTAAFAGFFPHELSVTLGASPGIYGLMGVYLVYLVAYLPRVGEETPRRQLLLYGAGVYLALDLAAQAIAAPEVFPLHGAAFFAGLGLGLTAKALGLRPGAVHPAAYAYEALPRAS